MKVLIPIEHLNFKQLMYVVSHENLLSIKEQAVNLHSSKLTKYDTSQLLVKLIKTEIEIKSIIGKDSYRDSIYQNMSNLHMTIQAQVDTITSTVIDFGDLESNVKFYRYYLAIIVLTDATNTIERYVKEYKR